MEIKRSPENEKRRNYIINKLATFGTKTDPRALSADQLILYLVQWLRLSHLISVELSSPTLSMEDKHRYKSLQLKFEGAVKPQLIKYKDFLNNQESSTLQSYFALKISEFLTLSQEIRKTNPSLAGEILEQAEMFLQIYQSSIETHIFQTADIQIKTNINEVKHLISETLKNPKPFESSKSSPNARINSHETKSASNPWRNDNAKSFNKIGDKFQNTITKVQIWSATTWNQIQEVTTEISQKLQKDLQQSLEYRRDQRKMRQIARDDLLFQKFSNLLAISRSILINDVTWQLKITRRRLMEKFLNWKKKLDFRIDGEYIVSQSISFFSDELDSQFKSWN
ncbi:MAG: hypothetical protein ACTSRK_01745 [Promethearchaeota archaeon]